MSSDLTHATDEPAVSDHGYSKCIGASQDQGSVGKDVADQTQNMQQQATQQQLHKDQLHMHQQLLQQQQQQQLLRQQQQQAQKQHMLQQQPMLQQQLVQNQEHVAAGIPHASQQIVQHAAPSTAAQCIVKEVKTEPQEMMHQPQQSVLQQQPAAQSHMIHRKGTTQLVAAQRGVKEIKLEPQEMIQQSHKTLPQQQPTLQSHMIQHNAISPHVPAQCIVKEIKEEPQEIMQQTRQGLSQCIVKEIKSEPQERLQQPQGLSQQQVAAQAHIIHHKTTPQHVFSQHNPQQALQHQQQNQHVYEQQLREQDIKNNEKELEHLQMELQKVQQQHHQQIILDGKPASGQSSFVVQQHIQHQQMQQQQLRQMQEQQKQLNLQTQQQQLGHQLQQQQQQLATTTIVTMPSSQSTVPKSPQMATQSRPQYILQLTPQIQRAQSTAQQVHQQHAQTNIRPSLPTSQSYQQLRHTTPHTTTSSAQRLAKPNTGMQTFGNQRLGNALPGNQQGTCSTMPAGSQNPGVQVIHGQGISTFPGSIQRDCNDKVLFLPADSSGGTSTPCSLSQNAALSQESTLSQNSSVTEGSSVAHSSTSGDIPEVHTPPLVSSTSGFILSRKSVKTSSEDQTTGRCCNCKKKSKCKKCPCVQAGGCNETCCSPLCQFKTDGDDTEPALPKPKKKAKPTAVVAPNAAAKKKAGQSQVFQQVIPTSGMAGPTAGTASLQLSASQTNTMPVQSHSGLSSPTQVVQSGVGTAADPAAMQSTIVTSPKTSTELCRSTVVQQMHPTTVYRMPSEGGTPGGVSPPLDRQQAAQMLASLSMQSSGGQGSDTAGSDQEVQQAHVVQACQIPKNQQQQAPQQNQNQALVQGTVQDLQRHLMANRATTGNLNAMSLARHVIAKDGKMFLRLSSAAQPSMTLQASGGQQNCRGVVLPGANQGNQSNRLNVVVASTTDTSVVTNRTNIPQLQQQLQQQQLQQQQQIQQQAIHGQQHVQGQIQIKQLPVQSQVQMEVLQRPQGTQQPSMTAVSIKPLTADTAGEEGDCGEVVLGSPIAGTQSLRVGTEYKLDYQDGTSQITTWDGEHFRIKGSMLGGMETPGQVRGGGGGTRQVQQRVIKGNATGLNMVQQRNATNIKVLGHQEMSPQPGSSNIPAARRWLHSSVGKEQLSRRALHPEKAQSEAAEDANNTEAGRVGQMAVSSQLNVVKRVRKAITEDGKYAVCSNCGQLSSDYEVCEGCKKPLPDQPRFFWPDRAKIQRMDKPSMAASSLMAQSSNASSNAMVLVDKKKFYGEKNNTEEAQSSVVYIYQGRKTRPNSKITTASSRGGTTRGRGRGRKSLPEPETVTILSSDDESGAMSPPMHGETPVSVSMTRLASPATPSPAQSPAPTSTTTTSVTLTHPNATNTVTAPVISRRQKMEDASGHIVMPTTRIISTGSPQKSFPNAAIESRSIRIGSLKGTPYEKVIMTPAGIHLKIEYENENLELTINSDEIMRIIGHFGSVMPVMFIYTSPQCAARVRVACKMTSRSGPYYDPSSKEECHRRITIIINSINLPQTKTVREICRVIQEKHPQRQLLREIEAEMANVTLVKSTPHVADSLPMISMPRLVADYDGDDYEEDDEPYDRSRSPSPPRPIFTGPITRLLTYPAPPATGGISVTNEDLFCLNEGEFLNDVIIDFYLKYLFFEILSERDRARTHIFSSFFYRRLTQRSKRNDEDLTLSLPQRRHSRVRTWTRHVDIFSKDFIIVPINESAHWYLAVICYPELRKPVYRKESEQNGIDAKKPAFPPPPPMVPINKKAQSVTNVKQEPATQIKQEPATQINREPATQIKQEVATDTKQEPVSETKQETTSNIKQEPVSDNKREPATDIKQEPATDIKKEPVTDIKQEPNKDNTSSSDVDMTDAAQKNGETTPPPGEGVPSSDRVDAPMETDQPATSDTPPSQPQSPPEIDMKQPCILIFDSLAGPTRGTVVRTLREYVQVEWDVRKKEKCGARVFNRDTFRGGNPNCPQQTNFSDCGIYVLQYVESFFECPIQSYSIPMRILANWFPEERVRRKRDELKTLILTLMRKLNPNLDYDPGKDMVT